MTSRDPIPKYISGRTSYLRVRLAYYLLPQLIRASCSIHRFGPPPRYYQGFNLAMVSSPGFGSFNNYKGRPIQARFHYGFDTECLNLKQLSNTRRLILQQARDYTINVLSLIVSNQFQILFHGVFNPSFHLSLTVLVHYRSYLVFSLGVWSPQIQKGVCRLLTYSGYFYVSLKFCLQDFHFLWSPIPRCSSTLENTILKSYNPWINPGLGFSLFARRLLRESLTISIPAPTQIFQFGTFPPQNKVLGPSHLRGTRLPYSDTNGSSLFPSYSLTFAGFASFFGQISQGIH